MSELNPTPLALMGAAFSAWAPGGKLPEIFNLLQENQRWQAALNTGKAWLAENDAEALKALLSEALDGPQSACLYANMAVALSADNSSECHILLDELGELLKIESRDASDLARSMEHLVGKGVVRERENWVLCAAALLAMSAADSVEAGKETVFLDQFVPEPSVLNDARKLLDEIKTEGVLKKIQRMSGRERKFLAANLFAMMFADGDWRGDEQELLDRFTNELYISRADAEGLLKATHALFNLSVFG
jgi:uncharacterized tellurite resistance protein B-like protein